MKRLILIPLGAVAGVVAFGSTGQATGEPWFYDTNADYVYDTVMVDRWGDDVADIVALDLNQNGIFESIHLDLDNDNVLEVTAIDRQENGFLDRVGVDANLDSVWETIIEDSDENGVDDYSQWEFISGGVSIVGPVTNPDGFYTLMMTMAAMVGPTFGTPDSDHDGYHDNIDYYPGDPFRA
jgi:hypothetical protein